jgi:hypothetical protein
MTFSPRHLLRRQPAGGWHADMLSTSPGAKSRRSCDQRWYVARSEASRSNHSDSTYNYERSFGKPGWARRSAPS